MRAGLGLQRTHNTLKHTCIHTTSISIKFIRIMTERDQREREREREREIKRERM